MTASPLKILFFGKRFYTNKDAWLERFGRMFRLPDEWAQSGSDVLLCLVDYHGGQAVDTKVDGMRVLSSPILSLAMVRGFLAALRFRPSVVVASGDCYLGLLGWLLARLSGANLVFDIYDKYDEFSGYVRPLGLDLFGFLRRRADLRFYPSKSLARLYSAESGGARDVLVANGVDEHEFRPLPMGECRRRLALDQDCKIVGYFGGMEPDRGVMDLINAIAMLRLAGENIRLLIGGKQHPSTPLDQSFIEYRGMVPHDQMPFYLNASDVLVIPYRISAFMDMGASCKIAEYLMCKRPIASTRTPNFVDNFPEQALELGAGLCAPANPEDLARSIAIQLQDGVILSTSDAMFWPAIAAEALAEMKDSMGQTNSS